MKLSLMFIIILMEQFYFSNSQAFTVYINVTDRFGSNISTTLFGGQTLPEELQAIYNKAKSVSSSKGPIINDNRANPEYRRSLIRKLRMKTKSLALRKVVAFFQNATDESVLDHLETLEYLVHEYDTAIDFMSIGGLELLTELIQLPDKNIASAALSVLSAAMQGNPTVQAIAARNNILEILLANLASKDYLSSILYAVSSYLRHMPDSQLKFCQHNGISLLFDIMKNHSNPLKFRIHAIDILGDISFELFEESKLSDLPFENSELIKEFILRVTSTDACTEIVLLLECNEYHKIVKDFYIHEKIISAMKDLQVVCTYVFESRRVQRYIEKLLDMYYPKNDFPWFSSVDQQSRNAIYQQLTEFYEKNYNKRFIRKTEL